jgi:uncharacterized membrane protein YfcA
MEFSFNFLLFTAPAVILFGIAKGAAIGSLALIATPLMLLVMPLPQALAVLLLVELFLLYFY